MRRDVGEQQASRTEACAAQSDATLECYEVACNDGLWGDWRRNACQALAVLLCMAVGAGIGYWLARNPDEMVPAVVCGAVVGMIAGASLSGLVLMFLPPRATMRTLEAIQLDCRRAIVRRRIGVVVFLVAALTAPPIFSHFAHQDSPVAWLVCLVWPAVIVGSAMYPAMLTERLPKKCPRCSGDLRPRGRWLPTCRECGLSLLPRTRES